MAWRPVLVGELESRARERIAAAAEAVDLATWGDPGLDRGAAGAALLFGCMARDGYQDAGGRAAELLEAAVAGLSSAQVSPWLFAGVTGVAWALEHLGDVVEIDADALDDIDDSVLELVSREHLPASTELCEGLVGLGVYALERQPRPSAEVILARTVAHLEAAPAEGDGLAHGVDGVVAFMAATAGARPLLAAAVARLGDDPAPAGAPAGWCSGDLSRAVALARAGLAAGEDGWIARARDLARRSALASAEDLDPRLAHDATFCHGAVGRAHLFNRLAQATGDDVLGAAALEWYRRALDLCDAADTTERGLIAGSAGVALALLAAVSPVAPDWDRALLVAMPPAPI